MPFWKRKPKEPGPPAHGPDFSNVDTREKALSLVEEGQLEALFLMPPEFGGPEAPTNIVYVPIGIADIKRDIDLNIIAPLVESGDVQHYAAVPEYRGRSFIPMAINIEASDPQRFESEINPVSVADFHATIHAALGIDPSKELHDSGRPVPITDGGKPITALFS